MGLQGAGCVSVRCWVSERARCGGAGSDPGLGLGLVLLVGCGSWWLLFENWIVDASIFVVWQV